MADTSNKPKTPKARSKRKIVTDRARATVASIEANPLSVIVGGLAVGALAGALIPRSDREREAMAPLGKRIADGAKAAVTAARDTGKEQLSAAVLGREAAAEGARKVFSSAVDAARGKKAAEPA